MWKDIKDWEDYYEVNTEGVVRNKLNGNIIKGDILYHKVDCIVNSACKSMRNDFGTY